MVRFRRAYVRLAETICYENLDALDEDTMLILTAISPRD
jgi:hypothetical protein